MTSPHGVERNGTRLVKLTAVDDDDWSIYIGRENQRYGLSHSQFANPFGLDELSRHEAVELYKLWFHYRIATDPEFAADADQLRGETLACWCVPEACHGEVILQWLDAGDISQGEVAFICGRLHPHELDVEAVLAPRFLDYADVALSDIETALVAMREWGTGGEKPGSD